MFDARASIVGDDAKFFFIHLQQAGYEIAPARREMAQDANLIMVAFFRIRSVIRLDDPAIKGQVHGGAQGIFDF